MSDLVLTVRRPPGQAEVHRFRGGPVTVGRSRGCDLRLNHGEVSDVHVKFIQRGDRWEVVDAGSSHGTRLGGSPLIPTQPHALRSADALAVGPFLIEVFVDGGGSATTDSRDTDSRARNLAAESIGQEALWVLSGPGAGRAAGLSRHRPLIVGSGLDCGLVIEDLAPRHFELGFDRRGLRLTALGGPVQVRGQRVQQVEVFPEDHIAAGDSVFQVRGGATSSVVVETPGGWSLLEKVVLLVLLGSAAALVHAWFFS